MKNRRPNRTLNARQRAFADAWCGPGTGTAAARAAGYSGGDGVLASIASRFMKDERVVERIALRMARSRPATVERWMVFADHYNGQGTGSQAAQIAGYEGHLEAVADELLDNARVMQRIWTRVGDAEWERWVVGRPPRVRPEIRSEIDAETDEELAAWAARIEAELVAPVPEPRGVA